jgi:hypothetical protein
MQAAKNFGVALRMDTAISQVKVLQTIAATRARVYAEATKEMEMISRLDGMYRAAKLDQLPPAQMADYLADNGRDEMAHKSHGRIQPCGVRVMDWQHNLCGIQNNSVDRMTVRLHLQKFGIPKITTALGDAVARVMLTSSSGEINFGFGTLRWQHGKAIACLSYSVEKTNGQ